VAVLGPLEVRRDGVPVPVAGVRLRALACRLAVEGGRAVGVGELLDAVWPEEPPADPAGALQSLVSRLRRVLGAPDLLRQEPLGYRLVLDRTRLDAGALADLRRRAAERQDAGDLEGGWDDLEEALGLWRGEPLPDAGDAGYAVALRVRWHDEVRAAVLAQADLALRLGRSGLVLGRLQELAVANPLDEAVVAACLRGLAALGRVPEALERYEQTRRTLREELGADPGEELRQLHLDLLGAADRTTAPAPAAGRSTLRLSLTTFVGREADLDALLEALATSRLTTVVGPGGAGKTRLAVEAAARWSAGGQDPAWLVELAPVTEAANLPAAVLGALGLRDARLLERTGRPAQDSADRLLDVLRGTACLLVVDNCEHLVEPVAALLDRVLAEAPDVRVLATSREPLALTGEVLAPLAPLPLPPAAGDRRAAAESPAVQLWLDRARAARPGFVLDDATLGPVTEIVRRLDGLPLAIELAAARLRVLPVGEIADRLSDRFRLLTGGNRTSLPRHRTLRAVVAWSWDLLSPAERLLAERLSVFPAGADVAAARAVCGSGPLAAADLDELLLSLVDKSLLQTVETPGRPVRFRMLETLREYGVERLAERGELAAARDAHASYFAGLAVALEPVLRSRNQLGALATLGEERENIAGALRHLGESGHGAAALELVLALVWYWSLLDDSTEATTWLRFVLERTAGSDHPARVHVRAFLLLAELSGAVGHGEERPSDHWDHQQDRVRVLVEELAGAPRPPFPALEALQPVLALFGGRPDLAESLMQRSLATADPWLHAAALATMASYAENEGDLELMRSSADAAYATFTEIGDRWGLSATLVARARVATLENRLPAAVAAYEEAAGHVVALGSAEDDLYIRLRLSDLYARLGDVDRARVQLEELRRRGDQRPPRRERTLFAEAALASLEWRMGETEAARARIRRLRRTVAEQPDGSPLLGHVHAVVLGAAGAVEAAAGDLAEAEADLVRAYTAGVGTRDMPIMASVGIACARLALARGRHEEVAVLLGASAQLLGGADASDPDVRELTDAARAVVGDRFDELYTSGWTLSRAEALARLDPTATAAAEVGPTR